MQSSEPMASVEEPKPRNSGASRTLILHGGMHKTGSSAIQAYLYEHLDEPDVEYFSADRANSSLILLQAFHNQLGQLPKYKSKNFSPDELAEKRQRARARFRRCLEATDKETVVISAESFSLFDRDECADLVAQLREFFSDVRLVLYIRPPYSRIESAFQQKLKVRFVPLEHEISVNYKRKISEYDALFGPGNVCLRLFDPARFPGGSVVRDFLDLIGVKADENITLRANVSLSLQAVQLLYIYRREYPQAIPEDKALVARLATLAGSLFRMHPALLERTLVEHGGSIAWLEDRMAISLHDETLREGTLVETEQDLLTVPETTLEWLEQQVDELGQLARSGDPEALARVLRDWAESL